MILLVSLTLSDLREINSDASMKTNGERYVYKIGTFEYMRHASFHWNNPETDSMIVMDSAQEASTIVIYSVRWSIDDQYILHFIYSTEFLNAQTITTPKGELSVIYK